jgi:hypothetical protein
MTTRPMKMRPAELELVSRVTKSEMIEYMTLSPSYSCLDSYASRRGTVVAMRHSW